MSCIKLWKNNLGIHTQNEALAEMTKEMNDEGLYGSGQLATLLRSRYCDPKITSICKTDGLTYKVREIVEKIEAIVSPA